MNDSETLVQVGERFEQTQTFTREAIRAYALALGDLNPAHHDLEVAKRLGFPDLIAAGAHSVAPFTSMVATHYAQEHDTLGLEFSFKFLAAVVAGDTITMRWMVRDVQHKEKLGGELVFLDGEMINQHGKIVVSSQGTILVKPKTESEEAPYLR